jgi:DNA-binding NarL/FixJ family response regulator
MDIRVAIVEDHKKLKEGLVQLVNVTPGFVMVGAYDNGDKIIQKIVQSAPDVILMDIQMPGTNGIEAVQLIRKSGLEVKIIMQTVFEDDDKIFAAICAGANGYILKNTNPEKFMDAIREAYHGGAPMTGSIASKVLSMFKVQSNVQHEKIEDLSDREKEILGCLVKGMSYKMIADHCHISYDTVRFHMKNIYSKLHVASMTEAVAKAIQLKLT